MWQLDEWSNWRKSHELEDKWSTDQRVSWQGSLELYIDVIFHRFEWIFILNYLLAVYTCEKSSEGLKSN